MAWTMDNPQLYFQPVVYSGTSTSTAVTLPGTEDMPPDAVWTKSTSNAETHCLYDSVRGTGKRLRPDDNAAENDEGSNGVSAFSSDGFTTGEQGGSGQNGLDYVAWCWKMGTTSGITTTGSNITPAGYSFNQTAGQSIIKWAGTGSDHLLPHGLGKAPDFAFIKVTDSTQYWMVYHSSLGNAKEFYFNVTNAAGSSTTWNTTDPTTVNMSLDSSDGNGVNYSGKNYVGYFFANTKGYSKAGKWTGNANANGPVIHCGFTPAMILYKNSGGTDNWIMKTKTRQVNTNNYYVKTDENAAEVTSNTISAIDFLSNGFKVRATDSATNGSDATYVYIAFAESPLVNSNGVPATAV